MNTPKSFVELKRRHPDKVSAAYRDQDGLWIEITLKFYCPPMGCRTIHEDTVKEALALFKTVRPATLEEMAEYD
jgi:hypothetical protein